MENKITIVVKGIDQKARDFTGKIAQKQDIINERTKKHTTYIQELKRRIQKLEDSLKR